MAEQRLARGAGGQRRPGGIPCAAHALGLTGAAVLPADAAGRCGAAACLASALSPRGAVRLAGLDAAVRCALLGATASGCTVASGCTERGPCARLLVAVGRAGAGVALPATGAIRALQRLALVGLGAVAKCLFMADGPLADDAVTSLAMAAGGLSA